MDDNDFAVTTTPDGPTMQSSEISMSNWSEGLEPIFENLATQIWSPEQLRLLGARKLRRQPQRYSTFQPPVGDVERFQFRALSQEYARPDHVDRVKEEIRELSDFTSREVVVQDEISLRSRLFYDDFKVSLRPPRTDDFDSE